MSTKGKRSLFQLTVNALVELWTWDLLKEPTAILLLSMKVGHSELSLSYIGGFCSRIFFISRLQQMFHVIIVHPTVSVTMKDLKKHNKIWDGSETHVIIRVTVSKSRIKIKNRNSLRKTVVSEVWGTSTESLNWWLVTSQIWVVLLTSWGKF